MSKALQAKIDELFEAVKDLRNLEEIKPHCEAFNEWINTSTNYSHATLGTKLSAYGFYKKFKSIPLEQNKNAVSIPKHNPDGTVKGHELKHYATVLCGLDKERWNDRNQTTRVIERLENSTEIDPDRFLETTGKLLASNDPHELAVGLIAATGRRPHEIIARAKFTAIPDKTHHVMFAGQGKKRGETPVFEIATLFPADYIIKALVRFRKEASTQALLKEVKARFPKSETRQNVEIDNRRGQSLRRVVRDYFGDKGASNPVLAFRHNEDQGNNKALRAAYAVLATERDCKGGYGAKILHASRILGHFTPAKQDDRILGKLGTSVGYSDYYVTKPVQFMEVEPEKEGNAKVYISDLENIKELQKRWNLPNQREAIKRLLEAHEQHQSTERQLLEARQKIARQEETIKKLQEELEMSQQQVSENPEYGTRLNNLESKMEQVLEILQKVVAHSEIKEPVKVESPPEPVAPPATRKPSVAKPEIDWAAIPSEQLKGMKADGAVSEKIYRAFCVIAQHNDNAPSNDERWYIGASSLSQVSGCNRQAIGAWIKSHQLSVDDHNGKYGLGQYHNKRHKEVEITDKVNIWREPEVPGQEFASVVANPPKKITKLPATATTLEIIDYLGSHPSENVQITCEGKSLTYARVDDESGNLKTVLVLETGEEITA